MKCPQCGKEWPENFKVCPICAITLTPTITADTIQGQNVVSGMQVIESQTTTQATDESIAAGGHVIIAGAGARVIIGEPPVETPALDPTSALAHYLRHVIAQNRYLALQGIRSGGKLVSIELEHIYVTLRATRQRTVQAEEDWLRMESCIAPGENGHSGARLGRMGEGERVHTETVTVSVNEALAAYPHLVVLGDPGSGKTTLLRYLTLLYAHDLASTDGTDLNGSRSVKSVESVEPSWVAQRLGLTERRLPLLLPLRRLAAYLKAHHSTDDGTEGCALLLEHLRQMLAGDRVDLPPGFFDPYLEAGNALVLLDGLDEVADPDLRKRVARLVEAFTAAYPRCRFVVSSRIVGYTGAARLGGDYTTTTVRDFTDADITQFLRNWHLAVGVGQMGPGETAQAWAEAQTQQLLAAIRGNERVRDLAINPLLLTVIALVHRDRVKLPDRRAELYAEAVDVLLGKWDEAKGVQEVAVLEDRPFDVGDKRLLLQQVALTLHETQRKDIPLAELRQVIERHLHPLLHDSQATTRAVDRLMQVVEERTGLLIGRGEGIYAFSHLTFQEYLAALAMAARDDYVTYTLQRCGDPWWREAILLEAGFLSLQSRERTTRLIRALADCKEEAEPYHNLVLAAECLRDVGGSRVEGDLEAEVQRRLRADIELDVQQEVERRRPHNRWETLWRQVRGERKFDEQDAVKAILAQKAVAMEALVRAGAGYWTSLYGEPEWVEIPAGQFWMGGDTYDAEMPVHQVFLEIFWIARTPVTNAQYRLFVEATQHQTPEHWENDRPPKDQESHPVVNVSWRDAIAYCQWLAGVTGKAITLPSEAQWEKAARGDQDWRAYPWGDTFEATRCNCAALGLGRTTPVGIFPAGASPYGVLDLSGNVWEWTRSLWGTDIRTPDFKYPYETEDGREDLTAGANVFRVLRGGAFDYVDLYVRCAHRHSFLPYIPYLAMGFRVVASPIPSDL